MDRWHNSQAALLGNTTCRSSLLCSKDQWQETKHTGSKSRGAHLYDCRGGKVAGGKAREDEHESEHVQLEGQRERHDATPTTPGLESVPT
jgi:hypothetical protein